MPPLAVDLPAGAAALPAVCAALSSLAMRLGMVLPLLYRMATAAHCEAILYGDTPKGTATFSWKASFTDGTFSTFHFVKKARDNEASSIEVRGKGCLVTIFGGDLSGWSATFTEGVYLPPQFRARNAIDNEASSLTVGMVRRETQTAGKTGRLSRVVSLRCRPHRHHRLRLHLHDHPRRHHPRRRCRSTHSYRTCTSYKR